MYSPQYPEEQKYFDLLWQISLRGASHGDVETAEGSSSDSELLSGNAAVQFFNKSNVGTSYLEIIWSMCTPTDTMSKRQFYTALRYICMIQNGNISQCIKERMTLERHLNIGLPRFSGIQAPVFPTATGNGKVAPISNSIVMASPVVGNNANAYAITAVDYGKYLDLFIYYDSDCDGYLTFEESIAVFSMSGLHLDISLRVFQLADCDNDSQLNSKEFAVAFHLILCNIKKGLPIPKNASPHKSIPSKSGYINPEDGIMLVRREALIRGLSLSNCKYWKERGHIYDLIPLENNNFKEILIDIICLDQNSANKMRTLTNSDLIYKNASEYHIMEVSSLSRGWVVYEMSNMQRTKVPIFHDNDPFSVKKLNDIIDRAVGEGFRFMKLSNEGDRQHVVQAVLNNFGSFEGFIERLKELQSIYCGNLKPKASTPSIVSQRRPVVNAESRSVKQLVDELEAFLQRISV
eukprot:gene30726-40013_t